MAIVFDLVWLARLGAVAGLIGALAFAAFMGDVIRSIVAR